MSIYTDIPSIGLGTYTNNTKEGIYSALDSAMTEKYQMIDTAELYRNHKFIGDFFSENDDSRKNVWITTKLSFRTIEKGEKKMRESMESMFDDLNVDKLDLVLIHAPTKNNKQAWDLLRSYQDDGKIMKVGISNFNEENLEEFIKQIGPEEASKIYCNQIEANPFLNRPELYKLCKKNSIKMIAYGSLYKENDFIQSLAQKLNVSTKQILLKWAQQTGFSVIPFATNHGYIKENINLDFEILKEDFEILNTFNEGFSKYKRFL
jgi:diketogulonate reductase-like aldo/keto reductase